MRVHGWCEVCRKVKVIRVRWRVPNRPLCVGICAACESEVRK